MMRVDPLALPRDVIDGIPDGRIVSGAFHFVADAPHQDRWVILVFANRGQAGFELINDRLLVLVIETVPFMAQP